MSLTKKDLYIFSGTSNEPLAKAVCRYLDVPLQPRTIERFSNGTLHIQLGKSVRNKDVYIIQSLTDPVHRHIMQMLMMLDIARHGDARRVTAVIPYFAYGRSDKKDAPRICITAKLVAKLIEAAGADRVIAVTLHSPQTHGFFDVPLDHLTSLRVLVDHFRAPGQDLRDTVVVSPDVGYAKQAVKLASALNLPLAVASKVRLGDTEVLIDAVLGSGGPAARRAIVIDDEIATAGTMVEIVNVMHRMGTKEFSLACTHGVFTANAAERLNALEPVTEIVSTDTVYAPKATRQLPKLRVLSVASVLGDGIRCNHEGKSVGELFTYWIESMLPDSSLG
ncbi:MAG: ribose-phosphate pyrophosphokinase [Anaerolineae bacterium]|nr:ribose-phosphate pyrophosphokinase [Anaerolineae bacterium]